MEISVEKTLLEKRKYILEFIDASLGCISEEIAFETDDVKALCAILKVNESDFPLDFNWRLEPSEIDELKKCFGIAGGAPDTFAWLRPWEILDERPYKIHTNRELAMMLSGDKPFSAFSEKYPAESELEYPEKYFEPYVSAGLFVKKIFIFGEGDRKGRYVLYAKIGEEWRIEAYILLKATAKKEGWNRGFERMEGSLLGYADWQNDIHLDMVYPRREK